MILFCFLWVVVLRQKVRGRHSPLSHDFVQDLLNPIHEIMLYISFLHLRII